VAAAALLGAAPATGDDLPEPDDFYRIWGQLRAGDRRGAPVEPDLRAVPWHTLQRLALLGGEFVAPYRPVSAGEITRTLERARENGGPGLVLAAQRRQMAWLLYRHGLAGAPLRWDSCDCKSPQVHLAAGGQASLGWLGPGGMIPGQAGLGGQGLHLVVEPQLDLWSGRFWAGGAVRLAGPVATSAQDLAEALYYDRWPIPSNRPAEGAARRDEAWTVRVPRGVVGAALGSWSLTAGIYPAAVGPGLDGTGLTLTANAASLPQAVLRRTRPFEWSGLLGYVDPDHLLLRVGATSTQEIRYSDADGRTSDRNAPTFFQWLITWNHTSWWRTTVTHAAQAAPRRDESLWGDILQINLPLLGTTWDEMESGPVTDRIFTLAMEARFREAPWPLLPADAGRVWWEYGGEDFRPSDWAPWVPEISAPASQAGIELVSHRWDLAAEYLETRHPDVLWYSNSGFAEGFSNDGVVLGHPRGGGVETWTGLIRVRPDSGVHEWALRGSTSTWDVPGDGLPVAGRQELDLSWRRLLGAAAWTLGVGWVREDVDGRDGQWLRASLHHRF
jgi:hypothetical protein